MEITNKKTMKTVVNKDLNDRRNVGKEEVNDEETTSNNDKEKLDSDNEINNYNRRKKTQQQMEIHGYNIPIYSTPPNKTRTYAKEYEEYKLRLKFIARKVDRSTLNPEQKNKVKIMIANQEKEADQIWKTM